MSTDNTAPVTSLTPDFQLPATPTDKPTYYLNATALGKSACWRRYYYTTILGMVEHRRKPHIEYGVAFHKFAANWRNTGDFQDSVAIAMEHLMAPDLLALSDEERKFYTPSHLAQTCYDYAKNYKDDLFSIYRSKKDNQALVEQKFAWPIYEDDSLRILGSGTIDALGTYGTSRCFLDIKTSAVWKVTEYLDSYRLSTQMLFYRTMLDKIAKAYDNKELSDMSCLIDGVFISAKGPTKFIRSEPLIEFNPRILETFLQCLEEFTKDLTKRLHSCLIYIRGYGAYFPPSGLTCGACETKYGKCEFFDVCADNEYIPGSKNFYVKEYNPLRFDER